MNRHFLFAATSALLIGSTLLVAQGQPARGAGVTSAPTKAVLDQVIAAWASMDVSKAAGFYAKDPGLIFYDIAPRKYTGWPEYEKGTLAMFKTLKSLSMKVAPDAQVHEAGNTAWTTATVDGELVHADGSKLPVNARWTTVWEKRGTNWLIVHEHFSLPLPEPPAKPTK